jgi:hypothetical protein
MIIIGVVFCLQVLVRSALSIDTLIVMINKFRKSKLEGQVTIQMKDEEEK